MNDNKTPECADLIAALRTAVNGGSNLTGKAAGVIVNPQCLEYAADLLEQLTDQPPNDPLTLEELRGMDGEPVWVRYTNGSTRCRICAGVYDNPQTGGGEVLFEGTPDIMAWDGGKTWLAYRRKPDGGGE